MWDFMMLTENLPCLTEHCSSWSVWRTSLKFLLITTIDKIQLKERNPVIHITDFKLMCGHTRNTRILTSFHGIPRLGCQGRSRIKNQAFLILGRTTLGMTQKSHHVAFFQKVPLVFYEMTFKFHGHPSRSTLIFTKCWVAAIAVTTHCFVFPGQFAPRWLCSTSSNG